jgi:hypothetical protein
MTTRKGWRRAIVRRLGGKQLSGEVVSLTEEQLGRLPLHDADVIGWHCGQDEKGFVTVRLCLEANPAEPLSGLAAVGIAGRRFDLLFTCRLAELTLRGDCAGRDVLLNWEFSGDGQELIMEFSNGSHCKLDVTRVEITDGLER